VAQDLLQELQSIRAKAVTNLEAQHQRLLTDTLRRLEQEVVNITSSLPIQDGVLFNTRLAIEIRPKLQQAIEELYLKDVQTFVNDYDKIAGTIVATYGKLPIPSEFKQITEADLVTIQQLKKIAFSQFQNLGNEFTNTLAQEIYQSTLVGKPFGNVVQTIRDKINGIYQQADTQKREDLVNFIQEQKIKGKVSSPDVQTAIDELKQNYGSTVTGENLYSYSSQIVGDALMGFDGQFAKYRADELGLTSFIYHGSILEGRSRNFCKDHANKIFTEEEARTLWQTDWQGKSGSDPFLDRGGYNCRHHWQPTSPDWGTIKEDGTFEYDLGATSFTDAGTRQETQTNIPIIPPVRTTARAVATAPEVFTAENTFVADKAINISSLNKVLQSLEGQKEIANNIQNFVNTKKIVPLFVPNSLGSKAVKAKLLPEINKIYKNVVGDELSSIYLKGTTGSTKGYMNSTKNFIITYVNKKDNIDFLKIDLQEVQKGLANVLERTANNKGTWEYKKGGQIFNLDWSTSNSLKLNKTQEALATTMHELGHQIHYWATTENGAYSTRAFPEFPKTGLTKLTRYGETNEQEYHAELFTFYSLNKNALLKYNPALVTYMEGLIDKAIKSNIKYKR
jgi:predicted regulator of Ras-like GTPase activity (Roadblock/LC7/MglB family)